MKPFEEKGIQDVKVYQLCESDAVAAYSSEEARNYYKNLTGLSDDDLYSDEEIEIVPMDKKIYKDESMEELITVEEVVKTYWEGSPFIAVTEFY